MKHIINGFTEGTVDAALQAKLDNDYTSEASECLNFYRDKSGVTKRRPPLRLYRDSKFTEAAELTNLIDYIKHNDVEYSIQGPTTAVTSRILPIILAYTNDTPDPDNPDEIASAYSSPNSGVHGDGGLTGTFISGSETYNYTIDYRVIRYAASSTDKAEYVLARVELSADQIAYFFLHNIEDEDALNLYKPSSFEYTVVTAINRQPAFGEAHSRLNDAFTAAYTLGYWIDPEYDQLPDELYIANDEVKIHSLDAEVQVRGYRNARYYTALSNTRFRPVDLETLGSRLIDKTIEFDKLRIACVPIYSGTGATVPPIADFSYDELINEEPDVATLWTRSNGILTGQREAAKTFANALGDNLTGSITAMPHKYTVATRIAPDIKWKLDNRHGMNYFSTIVNAPTYKVHTLPEINFINNGGWARLPWGRLLDYAASFNSQAWASEKQNYIDAECEGIDCSPLSPQGNENLNEIRERARAIYGDTWTFSGDDSSLYSSRRRSVQSAHGRYIQAPGIESSFGRGIASSNGSWYGALGLVLTPTAETNFLVTAANLTLIGAHTELSDIQTLGYVCYVYYNDEKLQNFYDENYIINAQVSRETGADELRPVNIFQYQRFGRPADGAARANVDRMLAREGTDGSGYWQGGDTNNFDDYAQIGAIYHGLAREYGTIFQTLNKPAWLQEVTTPIYYQGMELDFAWAINPIARDVNEVSSDRQVKFDDRYLYISSHSELRAHGLFGSFNHFYNANADNVPSGDTERSLRGIGSNPPTTLLAYELRLPETINTVDFREALIYITSNDRLRFFPTSQLAANQIVSLRDLMPERGLDTPLSYESTAFYGAQGNQVISFRYYEQSQGYQGRNETKERTLPIVTQLQTMIQNHNLIVSVAGGTNKLFMLCLKENRQTAGFYDLEFDSNIRKVYKLDHDRLLLLFEDGLARIFDLALNTVVFQDENIVDGAETSSKYTSRIFSLPVIRPTSAAGFDTITHVQVVQAFINVGNSAGTFTFVIKSEGKDTRVPIRATSAESVTEVLNTSLPTVLDNIPRHIMKAPVVGIETDADTDLQFTSIVLELKDKS